MTEVFVDMRPIVEARKAWADKATGRRKWARAVLNRQPTKYDYMGISYEEASRRAVALCEVAAETGQTINCGLHLEQCSGIMLCLRPASAA